MSKSATTTDLLAPVHPGEVLSEEFLTPLGLSASALARRIGVPANRVSSIVAGKRAVTGDTALRLALAFGTTPEFWMRLQMGWDLAVARDGFEGEVERVVG
ncbi:HigA family addiction module antitoxin [Jannaschia formosa]|uniref:HigA family addiction module antitoxin n=1 Tax=Jannaschia formosa TaxID=2259592 RepID=UPI000E1BF3CF|nr:HigA family addiction module antitoxin [Jannaschia formosa]TFL19862.1 addiction module antidote protein, HigA family [Jannaschia formosa]